MKMSEITFDNVFLPGPVITLPEWVFPTIYNHPGATYEGSEGSFTKQGRVYNTDRMYGNGGDDTLYGNGGVDYLYGGAGNDTLYANGRSMSDYPRAIGTTVLDGGTGDDRLIVTEAGIGRFSLAGGEGDDLLQVKGQGTMTLAGGAGNDRFVFAETFQGSAVITDFQIGQDRLGIGASITHLSQHDGNIVINTAGASVELVGVTNWQYVTHVGDIFL